MNKQLLLGMCVVMAFHARAQETPLNISTASVTVVKSNGATPTKNQGNTGTCWCFAGTSMIESQCLQAGIAQPDISEMYTVRNVYRIKARNYVLRLGNARFSEGGLGHDVLMAVDRFGLMPESAYSGLKEGDMIYNHAQMVVDLQKYLDSILKKVPVAANWEEGYTAIMDQYMGRPPVNFSYNGKDYTPETFAREVVKFNVKDYVNITSFTHHPFYEQFVLEVPDNHANGSFYNVPLEELIGVTKRAVDKGFTVMWDADVSNAGFMTNKGYALSPAANTAIAENPDADMQEVACTPAYRQQLFESLITQDDHLMHITGVGKSTKGKPFFIVKNSWGSTASPFGGYLYVSEPYFAVNTINVVVPKAALDKAMLKKLKID